MLFSENIKCQISLRYPVAHQVVDLDSACACRVRVAGWLKAGRKPASNWSATRSTCRDSSHLSASCFRNKKNRELAQTRTNLSETWSRSSSAIAERSRDARVTSIRKIAKWNF